MSTRRISTVVLGFLALLLALLQAVPAAAQVTGRLALLQAVPTAAQVTGRLALLPAVPTAAQGPRLALLPGSRVWVDGTSNKNDWTVKATQLSGFVNLQLKNNTLTITAGGFTVVAKSLVSEHGVIMDRLMQGALRSDTNADIVYELGSATPTPGEAGKYAVATQGRVTIAGVTKDVAQTVTAERLANGTIRFTGSQPLLMSDFGMKPPTAMFGALRTANRVVVNFDLIVKP